MSAHHNHDRGHDPGFRDIPVRSRRIILVLLTCTLLFTVVGAVAVWPSGDIQKVDLGPVRTATVTDRYESVCPQGDAGKCVTIVATLDTGERVGLGVFDSSSVAGSLQPGKSVQVERGFGGEYFFRDVHRGAPVLLLVLVFSAAVVVLAKFRGVRALGALGLSVLVLLAFTAPALLTGRDPVLVCVASAAIIAVVSTLLTGGFRPSSVIALISILAALAVTFALGALAIPLLDLTGTSGDAANLVFNLVPGLDFSGLLLGGFVLGTLGALDDLVVTQVEAVRELALGRTRRGAFTAAMRVGRAHVAAATNTLVMAYVGASLPLLLLFAVQERGWNTVAGSEVVATEIARSLVGSLGLVLAVPLATALAAWVFITNNDVDTVNETSPHDHTGPIPNGTSVDGS